MSSNGANLLVNRSAKEEESKKEERQPVLCVADKQTDRLLVNEERWSRGESSDCPYVNCSQLSVGFRFDCDCDANDADRTNKEVFDHDKHHWCSVDDRINVIGN